MYIYIVLLRLNWWYSEACNSGPSDKQSDQLQSDACEFGSQYFTDEDIITNSVCTSSDDTTDAEDVLNERNTISKSTALQFVKTLLDYTSKIRFDHGNITAVHKTVLLYNKR